MWNVGNSVTNIFNPSNAVTNPQKTGFVFASRKLDTNNKLILATGGNLTPSPYIPFRLSAYKDGASACAYLRSLGFKYIQGYNNTSTIQAPDTITSNSVSGITTLHWDSANVGLENLQGTITSGSVTQSSSTASATVKNITIDNTGTSIDVIMVNSSPDFDTSGNIVITVTIGTNAPNPYLSDEVVVFAYWYFQYYALLSTFTTAPDLWISVLIQGRDTDICPAGIVDTLDAPFLVETLADNSVNVIYPITSNNLGLLPNAYFGNSIVEQNNVANGTYNGYIISGNKLIINVTNVTGIFDTANPITITIDNSQNGGLLTGNTEIGGYAMCYPVANQTDLARYPAFMSLIATKREPDAVQQNQFNIQGYTGFIPAYINQYPISYYLATNTAGYVNAIKVDVSTAYQYPITNPQLVAQSLYVDMMNEAPYLASVGTNAVLSLAPSNNKSSHPSIDTLDQLVSQGNSPVGVTNNQCYWYQRVCGLQTISGSTDSEFRYQALQLKKRWLDRNIELANRRAIIDPQTGQRLNNNPFTLSQIQSAGSNVLTQGVDRGILGNVNNSVTVNLDPADPTRIQENISTSIVAQNNGVDTVVYINPYTINNSTGQ